jgi:hypothetical protein
VKEGGKAQQYFLGNFNIRKRCGFQEWHKTSLNYLRSYVRRDGPLKWPATREKGAGEGAPTPQMVFREMKDF